MTPLRGWLKELCNKFHKFRALESKSWILDPRSWMLLALARGCHSWVAEHGSSILNPSILNLNPPWMLATLEAPRLDSNTSQLWIGPRITSHLGLNVYWDLSGAGWPVMRACRFGAR